MPRLLSVNVGLPRDVEWRGRKVHTGIFKIAVLQRRTVRRLNVDGDGQGDLAGHGGEHRAVFVYQIESHRYWQERLGRTDFDYGQFGENFTVEGLPDDAVCIGDRYQIGSALFEVTQPRVTCYRIGIRMNEPRMPAWLTSSGRPGFYFRVLQEGEVGAGDEIVKIGEAPQRMTVAEINALLYSPNHPRDRLECALRIGALSSGWRSSFDALLHNPTNGNSGLAPAAAAYPATPGFHRLRIGAIDRESADVLSFTLQSADGRSLAKALPGQFVVVGLFRAAADRRPLFRSYSISSAPSTKRYRISVKIEPKGAGGAFLSGRVRPGDVLDVSSPRGSFVLQPGERPLVLLSAGIGATPVLAMLSALASSGSTRQVLWLHAARDGEHHPFAAEVRRLVRSLEHARSYVCYSRPSSHDEVGVGFDAVGHLSVPLLGAVGISRDAEVYLCGPSRFMADMREMLVASGVAAERIRIEVFGGRESMMPGVVASPILAPHAPFRQKDAGMTVSFARSGVGARWDPSLYRNILELAEACDVPVRWSCRAGVCHSCESGLVSGAVAYAPEPLDGPAEGNVLVCCSQPASDIVLDL